MHSVVSLARKETRQMFVSPIAYTFMVVFVGFVNYMFFKYLFRMGQVSMAAFFIWIPWIYPVVLSGVTMRTWAEERKQGTIEFLMTAPVKSWHIVMGKFLASLVLLAACLLFTIGVPITVSGLGDLDWGPVIGGYVGALLMGGTCIAIGMFLSSFTRDQIVSFLVTVIVLFALILMGMPFIQAEFEPGSTLGAICRAISPVTHYESIGRGVIDLRDLYYFVAVAGLFLYLNTRVLETRRRA